MRKDRIIIRVIVVVMFLISLYMTEAGFCGSQVVATYNGGFGTVDMKSYDAEVVRSALSPMGAEGLYVYKLYYLMDFMFVLCFGAFQIMLINDVFSFQKNRTVTIAITAVPVIRGLCDIVENVILLVTINTFPQINETAISVSARFTQAKLLCIRIWVILILVGIILRIANRIRKHTHSQA